jgi:hypothetical protein
MLYANYYQLADNMSTLDKLKRCMELSLYKTLATKHGSTVKKIVEKHGATTEVQGKEYKILQVTIPPEGKEPLVATWGATRCHTDFCVTVQSRKAGS